MKTLILALFLLPLTQAEQATVYFYRLEEANRIDSRKTKVFLDERHLIDMPESEFVGFKLPPGRYVVRMKNKHTETPLTVEAGKTYYLRVSETAAGMGYRRDLYVMQAEQAEHQMRALKPLQKKNIKEQSFIATAERPQP